MKIPTNNGFYGHDSSAYIPDGSDIGNGADNEAPTQDGDFSEYMWMENEEEFDKQVMQQLEEEELMEQCIEAMLEDEREIRNIRNQIGASNGSTPSTTTSTTTTAPAAPVSSAIPTVPFSADALQPWSTASDYAVNTHDISRTLENLSVHDDLAKQSTLNPNAAEFIPQRRTNITSPMLLLPHTS